MFLVGVGFLFIIFSGCFRLYFGFCCLYSFFCKVVGCLRQFFCILFYTLFVVVVVVVVVVVDAVVVNAVVVFLLTK